jgi:hypothetical protein
MYLSILILKNILFSVYSKIKSRKRPRKYIFFVPINLEGISFERYTGCTSRIFHRMTIA